VFCRIDPQGLCPCTLPGGAAPWTPAELRSAFFFCTILEKATIFAYSVLCNLSELFILEKNPSIELTIVLYYMNELAIG